MRNACQGIWETCGSQKSHKEHNASGCRTAINRCGSGAHVHGYLHKDRYRSLQENIHHTWNESPGKAQNSIKDDLDTTYYSYSLSYFCLMTPPCSSFLQSAVRVTIFTSVLGLFLTANVLNVSCLCPVGLFVLEINWAVLCSCLPKSPSIELNGSSGLRWDLDVFDD